MRNVKHLLNHRESRYTRGMEESKRKRGGQPKPEDEKLVQRSIRLHARHWAKIDAAGLYALRKLLDRWRASDKAG